MQIQISFWFYFSSPGRTFFNISFSVGLLAKSTLSFCLEKYLYFFFRFKVIFSGQRLVCCHIFLTFQFFEYTSPLFSGLHGFWQVVCFHSYFISFVCNVSFFSGLFKHFLSVSNNSIWYALVTSLCLYYLAVF